MLGVEMGHCNAAIDALLTAYYSFMESTVGEALRPILAYGKSDTLGMDAMPEITIIDALQQYDQTIVITEETGAREKVHFHHSDDPRRFRTVFISDPTDRSAQIQELLENASEKSAKVGDVVRQPDMPGKWEAAYGGPATITGGSSAITCIRRGVPIFAVIVNYITQQLYVSCSAGNFTYKLPEEMTRLTLDQVRANGDKIFFRGVTANHHYVRRFVTFMGKCGYKENFLDSNLMDQEEMEKNLWYGLPGGPLRVLYLSTMQPSEHPIGFILSNGEKIGEWVHWLPFIRFARMAEDQGEPALRIFEVYQDRPWTKEGILMSTPPSYSIFKPHNDDDPRMVIDVGRFSSFGNPSKIRATLIVTPANNVWATRVVNQYGYRPIELYSE